MDALDAIMKPSLRNPLKRALTMLLLFALVILLITTYTSHRSVNLFFVGPVFVEETNYAIVFDAGSTGTRIHVFEFERGKDGSLVLRKETFSETKPGLSSLVNNVMKAEESVRNLLKSAKDVIPLKKRRNTPVMLKATAGLRLLPGRQAKMILQQVRLTLDQSPFKSNEPNAVSIMDGDDEGLYGWETVNYLLGNLQQADAKKTYGIVDMGGGSFQVTYALSGLESTRSTVKNNYIRKVSFGKHRYHIYDHSYLGLGLMSTRAAMLNESFSEYKGFKVVKVISPCFPRGFSHTWKFHGIEFQINGNDQCSFESCREVAKKIISRVAKPVSMNKSKVFLLSYFFDRAVEAGLIDSKAGGELQVEDYIDAAQNICQRGNAKNRPFFCLDMTYLSTLLTDGFGFGLHKRLLLRNKIRGFEVSWPLGVALSLYY